MTDKDAMAQEALIATASDQLLDALREIGVEYIFANLGSDHPAIIESWAKFKAQGAKMPNVVVCPHEMVALSAAHGYAQASGKMQAVLVHVDVGTQNLGGALHNAMRGRVPVLILSGTSPVTVDGELKGSRNEFIHYLQDVFDQRGIVRGFTKWNYDLHTGANIDLIVKRAAQLAQSDPRGPVYMMAAREILEEPVAPSPRVSRVLLPMRPSGLTGEQVEEILTALTQARNPLVITSYLGRNVRAVPELVALCERLALPVVESGPYYMNFPADHPLHLGYDDFVSPNPYLAEADVVLVLDSDIPWMPQNSHVRPGTKLFWIDCDPLKEAMPLWYYSEAVAIRADAYQALRQINQGLGRMQGDEAAVAGRREAVAAESARLRREWAERESWPQDGVITPEFLTRMVREVVEESSSIVLSEAVSNYGVVWRHLHAGVAGGFFASGASSLGWHGGAALGMKLAHPDKTVVALTGDGSYVFSVPTAVHMIAAKYQIPFLTVIYNNGGWKSPKLSTLAVHPQGNARSHSDFHVDFYHDADLEQIASAAGGAYAVKVSDPKKLKSALKQAIAEVHRGRAAVVNVILPRI